MPDPPSTPEVAAVTGGMDGIGQGIAIALTQRDFDVVVCYRTIDPAIAERITTNAALSARLSFIRNDLADPADLPRFVDAIFAASRKRDRSCSYPPRMLSSQPRSAGEYAMSKATVGRRLSCLPFA
jgi:NAD(P)-dependent dehydrogenase (short-subunit alcohol dehydrogenase family)